MTKSEGKDVIISGRKAARIIEAIEKGTEDDNPNIFHMFVDAAEAEED